MSSPNPAWALCVVCFSCTTGAIRPPPADPSTAGTWKPSPPPASLPQPALAAPPVTDVLLPSGLRLVIVEHHRRPIVLIKLVIPAGASEDAATDAGRTFLAVQLAGDYYEKSESGEDLFEEKSFRSQVLHAGGEASFGVGDDVSVVGISGLAADTTLYLQMLSGALARPRHGKESFLARRDATLDALEDLELADAHTLELFLAQAAFGEGHAYAQPTMGTLRSLTEQGFGLEEVAARQRRLFSTRGSTLLVVGDVTPASVTAAAKQAFARWSGTRAPAPPVTAPAVPRRKPETGFIHRRPASSLLVCATRPLSDHGGPDATLHVLASILGGGPTSRLAAALRERAGLTYDASAQIIRRRHARALLACSYLRADRVEAGVALFRSELEALRIAAPTDEEVRCAAASRIAELESGNDDAQRIAAQWLDALASGETSPAAAQEIEQLRRVTPQDVHAAATKVLDPATIRWVVSGESAPAATAVKAGELGKLRRLSLHR